MSDILLLFNPLKPFFKEIIREVYREENINQQANLNLEVNRLTQRQAAKFCQMSIPTFKEIVRKYPSIEHGTGRKLFYLKHELNELLPTLRPNNSKSIKS